jgi:hypothetical protein
MSDKEFERCDADEEYMLGASNIEEQTQDDGHEIERERMKLL